MHMWWSSLWRCRFRSRLHIQCMMQMIIIAIAGRSQRLFFAASKCTAFTGTHTLLRFLLRLPQKIQVLRLKCDAQVMFGDDMLRAIVEQHDTIIFIVENKHHFAVFAIQMRSLCHLNNLIDAHHHFLRWRLPTLLHVGNLSDHKLHFGHIEFMTQCTRRIRRAMPMWRHTLLLCMLMLMLLMLQWIGLRCLLTMVASVKLLLLQCIVCSRRFIMLRFVFCFDFIFGTIFAFFICRRSIRGAITTMLLRSWRWRFRRHFLLATSTTFAIRTRRRCTICGLQRLDRIDRCELVDAALLFHIFRF
mmetsp:Transcript_28243/g.46446  ORF Transcript_28243/g.46446 Transcript_28243/m.46446 type:complete len:302 (-) Transcript_28243:165-1070(-)